MHDIRFIRENPDVFDAAMKKRGRGPEASRLLALDTARREATARLQEIETERNAKSKLIGQAKAKGDDALFNQLRAEVDALKGQMDEADAAQKSADEALRTELASLPNMPFEDVPEGADENDNEEVRGWGEPKELGFEPKDHVAIGEGLGGLDFEAAAAMSGARFAVLKGQLARLERALAAFMLDMHTLEHGYQETSVPLLVRDEALFGTGQLPKFKEDLYEVKTPVSIRLADLRYQTQIDIKKREEIISIADIMLAKLKVIREEASSEGLSPDDVVPHQHWPVLSIVESALEELTERGEALNRNSEKIRIEADQLAASQNASSWLIPTAEVSLTNLVRDAIHSESAFPMRLTAHTPCFRSEAGAAGRDTRGLMRMHQFYKVELVSIVKPEESEEELERMTGCAEAVLRALELPYRVMLLCAGDMGFGARKTYDLEVWLPSQNTYREISSCSNCGDFQARRMDARFKREGEKKPEYLHTLNGSGVAVGRALLAVLENHQNKDGSVTIPAALRPYMGGIEVLRP
ncbi:seryl-tRNA synthetase [Glycocaulis alkaliphilus]|uniref:Serine--tRNA ligase n=1 Tax=Glycocaulis alkaliphilus TaxID=1434191 RepID=A0A3T0E9B6_9PROT|nr:serine--tRNA ligase [Glycocaulis alkaliphilus]AZU03971.1 seryl-tRNA synthetase [Glycocaulis alkaliphilus]GGB74764.1 serine--tRNA ligase [Glycocaulis alkaliphilus]